MRRTHATVMVALLAALLLAAGCKSGDDDDADELPTVEYKVLGGRLVWCSGGAEDLAVPGNASSIGNNAFNNCGHIKTLTIPATVTYIMSGTFSRVTIDTIYFGGTYDDWDAMVDGFGFTLDGTPVICADDRIWIWTAPAVPDVPVNPDDWQVVDGVVKAYTGTETTVTLPDGVTKIEAGAIPAGTTVIFHGSREQWEELAANSDLTGLTAFAVDADGTLVGYQGSGSDIVIPDGVTAIGGGVFEGCTDITTVTIPKGVTDIGDGAFSGCAGLTDLAIPASVEHIGDGAFDGCTSLEDITYGGTMEKLTELTEGSGIDLSAVNVDISSWVIRDGVLISYYGEETVITIPDIVTAIGDGAFAGNAALTGVEIPAGVTTIGADAFKDCTGLANIVIPDGVTAIGNGAFSGCTGLTDITIPDGVTAIGADAFKDCAGLTDIAIPASVTNIGADAFAGCTNLDTITFAGMVAAWRERSEGSGVGDDVTVICLDGMWPPTVYVASTGSDDNPGSRAKPFATIQKAVDTVIARNDGATAYTIYVDGTLTQSVAASTNGMADFSKLDKNLTLTIKALSGTATLDGGARFDADGNVTKEGIKKCVIYAKPASGKLNLTLENLTVTGGNTTGNGGGIYFGSVGGTLTISDGTTIKGNTASVNGGGVYVNAGTFTMTGGTISDCTATTYGGGVCIRSGGTFEMSGTAKITGCKMTSTAGGTGGGGIYNSGTLTITGGMISGNTASSYGGGICVYDNGTFTMTGGTISGNTAGNGGGGIYVNSGTLTIESGTTISENIAKYGGGVYVSGTSATATITGCTIESCKATGSASNAGGGGIYSSSGTLTVTGGTISNCTTEQTGGGGIYLASSSTTETAQHTITGVTISGCTANYGGGVYVRSGIKFRMIGATITGCEASGTGGGVRNSSDDAEITGCVIKSCKATGSGSNYGGGGIYNNGTSLVVTGGEISGNHAYNGGGVLNWYSSGTINAITLANVKVSGNEADNYGGGVYNYTSMAGNYPLLTLDGGTAVSENKAKRGGGVYDGGELTLNGATVSQNTAAESGGDVYASNRGYAVSIGGLNFSGTTFAGDLYLDGKTVPRHITAHPDLACASGKTVCATITLPEGKYVAETKILQADGVAITQDVCDKFAVTPDPDSGEWRVVPDGANGVIARRTYTFKVEADGTEIEDGSELSQSATITLSEVRRDGVALTASDGTFTIELSDGTYSFASKGFPDTSATGLPATISMPPLPPVPIPLLVCVKAELANGIVIEKDIEVCIMP